MKAERLAWQQTGTPKLGHAEAAEADARDSWKLLLACTTPSSLCWRTPLLVVEVPWQRQRGISGWPSTKLRPVRRGGQETPKQISAKDREVDAVSLQRTLAPGADAGAGCSGKSSLVPPAQHLRCAWLCHFSGVSRFSARPPLSRLLIDPELLLAHLDKGPIQFSTLHRHFSLQNLP